MAAKRGRKSKYSDDVEDRVVKAISLGATYELAAAYGGISYETFRVWMDKYPAFSEAVKSAEGRAAMIWLTKIEAAATDGNWQAAAWKLERRYPEQYGRQVLNQQHEGEINISITKRRGAKGGGDD